VRLTVKDNETDFIYFEKVLMTPATELQVKALNTVSSSTRQDQLNAGLVFNIEFSSNASTIEEQRQNEDFLKLAAFVCQATVAPDKVISSPAFQ
jgi:hypothetical protein